MGDRLFFFSLSWWSSSIPFLLRLLLGFAMEAGREKLKERVLIWRCITEKSTRESSILERSSVVEHSSNQQFTLVSMAVRTFAMNRGSIDAWASYVVRFEVIELRQDWRPAVSRDEEPKKT